MPNRPQKVTKSRRSALKLESLETRQLLAGVTGAGTEVGKDIQHPNGNIYDQVLMTGSSVTVTADPGQITRVSFLDASGDIVQAEFAGAGSLTVSLSGATGPVAPDATKYNQAVNYMKGTASFTIQGSDATTNFSVFSVGTANANGGAANPIFTSATGTALTGGNNIADVQRITVVADPSKPNGSTFGGIRAGNALFSASSGVVGISAAGVQVQDTVVIGDIDASGSAIPTLIFGTNSQFGAVTVAGGDLVQTNGSPIANTGSYAYQVALVAGQNSGGTALPAQSPSTPPAFSGANPFNLVNNTFNLTTSPDTIPGLVGTSGGTSNNGNDTINGSIGLAATNPTFTPLDSINGGTGTDVFNLIDLSGGTAQPAGVSVTNVETVNFRSVGAATLDTSTWTGLTALNVTQATAATLTAPSTTAITAAGVVGGATTINGGSNVSVTSLGADAATTGAITIGGTTAPAGTITVTQTGIDSTALTAAAGLGAITTTGGTTVNITRSAGSTANASTDTTQFTVTEGTITVNGNDSTTSVTVTESQNATARNAILAVTGVKEVATLTFSGITAGQTVTIDGLTLTATKDLTDVQVASAFANLFAGTTQGFTALSSGSYSGALSANWTSAAASGNTVTFTGAATGALTDLAPTGTGTLPTVNTTTQGVTSASATSGRMGVVSGQVLVADAGATLPHSIATVSLTGFGAASKVTSDALSTLSLASSNEDLTIVNGTATTLGLTLNAVGISTDSGVVTAPAYTAVNITTTGADSFVQLTAGSATTLAVSGTKLADLSTAGASTLGSLTTLTVSGSASALLSNASGSLTSVNSTGTTGKTTVTINAANATFTGGAGVDVVTTTAVAAAKAISLGAGDDNLIMGTGAIPTSILDGGDGTDTITFSPADAATASANTLYDAQIQNFEKVGVTSLAAGVSSTVDMSGLDDINFVTQVGGVAAIAAVKEVFTVTFAGVPATGDTVIFDGTTDTTTTNTLANLVTVVAAGTYADWTVTASDTTAGTVQFTNKVATSVTDVAATDFTGTYKTGSAGTTTPNTTTQGVTAVGAGGTLTLTNAAPTFTLEITGTVNQATTITQPAGAAGTADVFNLSTINNGNISAGTITPTGYETINWTATDSKTSDTINTHSATINDTSATTLNLTGSAHVTLAPASTLNALATLNASALTGKLTASTNGVVAETINGGTNNDTLTARFTGDTLVGNAGDDTLTVNAGANLVSLTGGAGNDVFVIAGAPTNVNAYATIQDPSNGDRIKMVDIAATTETFAAAQLNLNSGTAVFQDYANYAIANSAKGAISWFQFGGNTYIIENNSASTTDFQNNSDIIVKLNGTVDLSKASFNAGAQELLIVV